MGNRVAELRKARGLSQIALAKLVGTTKNQLGKLERSERRLSDYWAQRLAPSIASLPPGRAAFRAPAPFRAGAGARP